MDEQVARVSSEQEDEAEQHSGRWAKTGPQICIADLSLHSAFGVLQIWLDVAQICATTRTSQEQPALVDAAPPCIFDMIIVVLTKLFL